MRIPGAHNLDGDAMVGACLGAHRAPWWRLNSHLILRIPYKQVGRIARHGRRRPSPLWHAFAVDKEATQSARQLRQDETSCGFPGPKQSLPEVTPQPVTYDKAQ